MGNLSGLGAPDVESVNISAEAIERRIRELSATSVGEVKRMDQAFLEFAKNASEHLVKFLQVGDMSKVITDIMQVRGEFQQLEITFESLIHSEAKAKELMEQLVVTAAKTPFNLTTIAEGAKQLIIYGTASENVNATLLRLGDIASGLAIPLNQIIELYGNAQQQGALQAKDVEKFLALGIPILKELALMYGKTTEQISEMVAVGSIGFADVDSAIRKMTENGGQFYNQMAKQADTLTGMIGNLSDAWKGVLSTLGENNEGLFTSTIEGATYLVKHFDDILNIVKAVTLAYGSYKAAVILNTLVTQGNTGVALIDNTVRQAKLGLLKLEEAATGRATAQMAALRAAQMANIQSLEAQLTMEERANLAQTLRLNTINSVLTAQQSQHLSNLGITTSSKGYEAAALSLMSTEQKEAFGKMDLTNKSAVYQALLEKEVALKNQNRLAAQQSAKADVDAAKNKLNTAQQAELASKRAVETAKRELYLAKESGDATRIAAAGKKFNAAVEEQDISRKARLAAQTELATKKQQLNTLTTQQATVATTVDTAATEGQITKKSLLTRVTATLSASVKGLWASMLANPVGWIIGAIGLVTTALMMFRSKTEEATDASGEFQDATNKEINYLNLLVSVLNNTEKGTKTHKDALEKLNRVLQEHNLGLLTEADSTETLRKKTEELTGAINDNAAARIRAKWLEKTTQAEEKELDKAKDKLMDAGKNLKSYQYSTASNIGSTGSSGRDIKSIQNMHASAYDLIQAYVMENREELMDSTGKMYTEVYFDMLNKISAFVKGAAGATDQEMELFAPRLKEYFNAVINTSKQFAEDINKTNTTNDFFAKDFNKKSKVTESVDMASMSFAQLKVEAKHAKETIEKIENDPIKVQTDLAKLDELKQKLENIQAITAGKEASLNTEAGISARINELDEERKAVERNGTEYKQLTTRINALQSKISNRKQDTKDYGKELLDKQKEAALKLEQAKIEAMEEGFEKRKAIQDFQHKQNLAAIDKERDELIKIKKDAGKGGLSSEEENGFKEREQVEEKLHNNASNKLFQGELEFKKSQYQSYFNWVDSMGKQLADEQFNQLLKGGNSYKEYVEREIENLENKKKSAEGLSEGEGNHLIDLKIQKNEINGVKSAMDQFKESVETTTSESKTLAGKIQAIADAKEKLKTGGSGLVGADQEAEAGLFLDEKEAEAQKELQAKILTDFQSYESKKADIRKESALLQKAAIEQNNEELLNSIRTKELEQLSALNADMLMHTDSWKTLFEDLDNLTVAEIDKLIKEIEEKMNSADMNLNTSDLNAVLEKLNQAKKKITDTNPFKTIGIAITDVFKKSSSGSKKNANDIKNNWKNLATATEGCFSFVNEAVDACDSLGFQLSDNARASIQMTQGIATAAIAMSSAVKTAEKGSVILMVISAALQAVQVVASLFNKDKDKDKNIKNMQAEVDRIAKSFDRLQSAMDKTHWEFNSEDRAAHEQRTQAIKDQIDALEKEKSVAKKKWDFGKYNDLTKSVQGLRYELEKAERGGDMKDLHRLQIEALRQQQDLKRRQIEEEKSKKKSDSGAINSWTEDIKDIDLQIKNMETEWLERLAGTDAKSAIDEFGDALVDAYCKGEDAALALGEVTKNIMKKAVTEAIKRQFLAKGINDAIQYLGESMDNDGKLSNAERAEFERMVNKAGAATTNALESIGDWIKDLEEDVKEEDPLAGAIKGMSEETASVLAGRINAIVINQSDSLGVLRQSLVYQMQTASNTSASASELIEIKQSLKRIETKESSLLSQGIV